MRNRKECGIENNAEVGMRPPARRGYRGLRPGGKAEKRKWEIGMADSRCQMTEDR